MKRRDVYAVCLMALLLNRIPLVTGEDGVTVDSPVPEDDGNGDDAVGGVLEPLTQGYNTVFLVLGLAVLLKAATSKITFKHPVQ